MDLFFLTAGLLLILLCHVTYRILFCFFPHSYAIKKKKKGNKNVIIKGEIIHSVNTGYSGIFLNPLSKENRLLT